MSTIERDVVLQSKDENGNPTIDLPITRLGNIEDTAKIKEKPVKGDYLAIVDSEDNGEMKKVPWSEIENSVGNASSLGGKTADDFAPAVHTHTAADITDFPESLPANGGNADTVGGTSVVTTSALGLHKMASGTAAANSTNCPPGCWYGQYE